MPGHAKIIVFAISVSGLAMLTWRSLWSFRSHGLYRLFAWAAVSALVLLNLEFWFNEPRSIHQGVSWILLFLSLLVVTWGAVSLRRGRQIGERKDSRLIGIEKTTTLITSGPYRYVRHPMYSSFLFGGVGVLLKHFSWGNELLPGIIVVLTFLTAKTEEAENISYFGDAYREYAKQTKMFVPFLF